MKLSLDGILPRYIYFNPIDEILHCEWLTLQDDEKNFYHLWMKIIIVSYMQTGICCLTSCQSAGMSATMINNNWIEVFLILMKNS